MSTDRLRDGRVRIADEYQLRYQFPLRQNKLNSHRWDSVRSAALRPRPIEPPSDAFSNSSLSVVASQIRRGPAFLLYYSIYSTTTASSPRRPRRRCDDGYRTKIVWLCS